MKSIMIKTVLLILLSAGMIIAENDQQPMAYTAEGNNRAAIQIQRQEYTPLKDVSYLLSTIMKKDESQYLPEEVQVSFVTLDPEQSYSYNTYQPWLNKLRKKVMFVLGSLDLKQVQIKEWTFNLYDKNGQTVKQITGIGHPPAAFYWDGLNRDYCPVEIGQDYFPEIVLKDIKERAVRLPQPKIMLDQFVWDDKRYLKVGLMQKNLFEDNQLKLTDDGQMLLYELSYLISQYQVILLSLEGYGSDVDMTTKRIMKLYQLMSERHLQIKKVQITKNAYSTEDVIYFLALKI